MESHDFQDGPGAALMVLLCSPGAEELGGDAASPTRGRSTAMEAAPRAKTSTMPPNLMQLMLRGLAVAYRGVRNRPESVANRKAFHLLALPVAGLQNQWRQGPVIPHPQGKPPGRQPVASGGIHRRPHRDRARSLLPSALSAHRQGQGGDCHGPQDRHPVLSGDAVRYEVRGSGCRSVRTALPRTRRQTVAATGCPLWILPSTG